MSFTCDYSTTVGKIRLRIPDTNINDYIFTNEEIEAFYDSAGTITRSLIQIYYVLASKYNNGMIKVDDITTDNRTVANTYLALAKKLEEDIKNGLDTGEVPAIYFGGVYQSEINSNKTNAENDVVVDNPLPRGIYDTTYSLEDN